MTASLPRPITTLLLACVTLCWLLACWRPGLFFVDDAWFYLQIGRNIALGAGSTFTGDGPTNGYHPLWQAMVAGLGWLCGGDRDAMLRGVLATQGLLVVVALATLLRAGRRFGLAFPGVLLPVLILGLFADRGWGSEGMLNLALHGLVLLAWQRVLQRPTAAAGFGLGLLAGLLVLARLDVVFFVAALWLVSGALLPRKALLLPLALGIALPVLPYVGLNLALFGHPVPVSGAIKSTFPWPELSNPVAKLGLLGSAAWCFGLVSLALSTRSSSTARPLLAALGLGAVLHGAYTALFTAPRWSTDVVYYYVTGVVCAGFCLGELARRYLRLLPSLRPTQGRALVGLLAALLALGATGRAVRGALSASTATEALAVWMADHLPATARIATVDAPGRLAWISGRSIHALDGLTQPPGFDEALRQPDVFAWARATGITHVVTQRDRYDAPWALVEPQPDGVRITVRAPSSGQPVGQVELTDPPLADMCALAPDHPCLEPVGLWPWPDR